ncbi:MAG TPA: hypothetical protein VNK04_13125 [Gemmataceae bacterium]|nr:hypothetical protein [Gemmataceae bacterium]
MPRRFQLALLVGVLTVVGWLGPTTPVRAQFYNLDRFFYYPYYYFPHNYWPQMSPKWPERPGSHYMRPPAYMAFPPFHEPHWRYEYWQPQHYYRGHHFWLDVF